MKHSKDPIGNGTRFFPSGSAVPQPTALPRLSLYSHIKKNYKAETKMPSLQLIADLNITPSTTKTTKRISLVSYFFCIKRTKIKTEELSFPGSLFVDIPRTRQTILYLLAWGRHVFRVTCSDSN